MGTRESYAPGTFSWAELATSDAGAAKRFYSALFGWEYDDNEMEAREGESSVYSMAKVQGRNVAGLFGTDDQPPHWNSYITVESADETAQRVEEAGGRLMAEPFDVVDAGRMAVVQDPTGAVVCIWEAKEHPGAGLVNAHGALTWNDLMTTDVAKAAAFYCDLFGWEVGEVEGAPDDRMAIRVGETLNGGMARLPEAAGDAPPHWLPYFAVDDVDAAAGTVGDEGGKVLAGPIEVPAGRFAICMDPQGATFAIFTGQLDD